MPLIGEEFYEDDDEQVSAITLENPQMSKTATLELRDARKVEAVFR